MPRLGGAVILMQRSSEIEYVVGNEYVIRKISEQTALSTFSEVACTFLQSISRHLLKNEETRGYSDVITFAFWCRKASLQQMTRTYNTDELRQGRGIVFHVAPSNVPVNFAYSFVAALLAGNASIVRLPSKRFRQVDIICEAINYVLEWNVPALSDYICMVRYGHNKNINDEFSKMCDTRVIWGGNRTIHELRKSPLKSRANEITFADRFSVSVINAEAYLLAEDKDKIAQDFYNDTYLSDQNACTSPRIIIWLGEKIEIAQDEFWMRLHDQLQGKYDLKSVQAVDKLLSLCLLGALFPAKFVKMNDNLIFRIELTKLSPDIIDSFGNCGFFLEYKGRNIKEVLPICVQKCQTISYYGITKEVWISFMKSMQPSGVDRIVPIGQTMNFSLVWDGHDLIREMSRRVIVI